MNRPHRAAGTTTIIALFRGSTHLTGHNSFPTIIKCAFVHKIWGGLQAATERLDILFKIVQLTMGNTRA
ncbi:MAG: hypothetical protein ACTSYL_10055 [Candidatus Thorarchaeota archaeon]